jgi:predicted lipid-binding transport protein (Tim44 family)
MSKNLVHMIDPKLQIGGRCGEIFRPPEDLTTHQEVEAQPAQSQMANPMMMGMFGMGMLGMGMIGPMMWI